MNNASLDLERLAGELQRIPTESDLENLEKMASIILNALGNNLDISPPDKRHVMQMLNLKVRISRNGSIKLEGWFAPESDGLLSITSPHFLKQTLLPP
jgi:hypothetical protein